MRKYIEISKIFFKSQIIWRFDVAMTMLFTVSKILFAYILWGSIFKENRIVAGFTFEMMLSYYVISSFLSQIEMSDRVSVEIGERIRGGTFSKYMVVPVNIQGYFTAQTFGTMSFYLIFSMLTTIIWVFAFSIDLIVTSNAWMIFLEICLIILGILFMIQLNYFLGMLAFKFQDIGIFLMIKENIISFITGTLVPLALLPVGVVSIMKFFPFYYVTYLPSMLIIGKNQNEALIGIAVLSIWLLFFTLLNKFAYRKLRVIYDGVGI